MYRADIKVTRKAVKALFDEFSHEMKPRRLELNWNPRRHGYTILERTKDNTIVYPFGEKRWKVGEMYTVLTVLLESRRHEKRANPRLNEAQGHGPGIVSCGEFRSINKTEVS